MFALVDCNNFYASCERLFMPHLLGLPVVVLSNNDGCVIARSNEAKELGIVMGTPAYMNEAMFKKNNVTVFSSNYTLYGDMSRRVMKTLAAFVPQMELYSIDEAFLDMSQMAYTNLHQLGLNMRHTVTKNTGIPVSVGIAPTKTLAKMANRYAKKKHKQTNVFYAANETLINEMLNNTEVNDIWGIGHQYAVMLRRNGITTAKELSQVPSNWMRKNMSVVGLRLWNELRGIPSIEWEFTPKKKDNICTSRSLGKLSKELSVLQEAISNHASACSLKLRLQNSVCRYVKVFIGTNPHKLEHKQNHHSIVLQCETPTNHTAEIIGYALKGLDIIFKADDYLYMKCGVEVLDIIPDDEFQFNMFDNKDRAKTTKALKAMDSLNVYFGKGTVRMAVQRFDERYKLRADHLSPRYTTRLSDILKIKI